VTLPGRLGLSRDDRFNVTNWTVECWVRPQGTQTGDIVVRRTGDGEKTMPGTLCKLGTICLSLEGLVDVAAETSRIKAELDKNQGFLNGVNAKLSNEGFVAKAPPQVIEQQRAKRIELTDTIARLERLGKTLAAVEEKRH
jgi:valyl-tRNA synthetase